MYGQVVAVNPLTSRVLLITDQKSALPVEDQRNGIRAIAVGSGDGAHLALMNVQKTAPIQMNDVFITSGLGGYYPAGYPVGKVTHLRRLPGAVFATITLTPTANLASTREVLLLQKKGVSHDMVA